ncbi:MAG: CRISPR-associated endoribonuclease Cas6 [Desulfotomaculum sp.]|nr:CRISPR-associated endoribonuclease Cas6 [Desulfotomaculum sp.]
MVIVIPVIHIKLRLKTPLTLPVQYNHLLQSFVYGIFPQQEAAFLHDIGFQHQKRVYKLFTFSQLQGRSHYDKKNKTITFNDKIVLSISSILPNLIEKTANNLLLSKNLQIHGKEVEVKEVEFKDFTIPEKGIIHVKAVSPITVYSTFEKRDGSKITHYFKPGGKGVFEHLIEENFVRKYEVFTGEKLPKQALIGIKPLRVTDRDKVVTKYKGTWITGWLGEYELSGQPEHLRFLLSVGLGAKNSIGMGLCLPMDILPKRD